MKYIIFIETQKYPEFTGGAEIFDYYLIQSLSNKLNVGYISHSEWDNCDLKFIRIPRIKPFSIFNPLFIFFQLLIKRNVIEHIHTRYSRSKWINYWPVVMINLLFNIPYVITIHGGGLSPWRFKLFYKLFFKRAFKIIGVSKRICGEYKQRTGIDITYSPPLIPFIKSKNSVSEIRNEKGIDKDAKVFLIVGSLKTIKNPLTIIKAILEIDRDYILNNKILFFFAGDGPQYNDIKEIIDNNSMDFVTLLGNVAHNSINEFFTLANYYIISSNFEGTPIGLLEAMFNKLSIIGSNVSGINSIIIDQKTGLLYNLNEYKELAEKIKSLVDDNNFALELANSAEIAFNDNFDYSNIVNFYSNIFNQVK
jgi:glycosyltransferase involved in cell wall biosynthesis